MITRFAIEKPHVTADGVGGEAVTWQRLGFLWGDIQSSKDYWRVDLDKVGHDQLVIELRDAQGSGLQRGWRLVEKGTVYDVQAVTALGRNDAVVLVTRESPNAL